MALSFRFVLLTVAALLVPTAANTSGTLLRNTFSATEVTKFRLIDTESNKIVLDPLVDGSTHYVSSSLLSLGLSVEAVVTGSVGSVRIDGRTENVAPYARCGDKNGDYNACSDLDHLGAHSVSATAYEKWGSKGKSSQTVSITFTIAKQIIDAPSASPVTPPTEAPAPLPTAVPVLLPTKIPTFSTPTPTAPAPSPECPNGEYFDGLQLKQCRKPCTFRRGCADINTGGMFPNYLNDDFICADTNQGNQCASKAINDQCGGCSNNEQCVQTTSGTFQCACQYKFGRQHDGSCQPVCHEVYPYGSCGKNSMCQDTKRGPLCTELNGNPYCNGSCARDEFCGRYTTESKFWGCLPM